MRYPSTRICDVSASNLIYEIDGAVDHWYLYQPAVAYAAFGFSCILGMFPSVDRPDEASAPKDSLLIQNDQILRRCGTLIPMGLLFVRLLFIRTREAVKIASETVFLFIAFSVFRLVFYLHIKAYNYFFSDHIFLLWCMLAMMAIEFKHTEMHLKVRDEAYWSWVYLILTWCVILSINVEASVTACWYHTRQATITAWIVGAVFFGPISQYFRDRVENAYKAAKHADRYDECP